MLVLSVSAWGDPSDSPCSATYRTLGFSLEAMRPEKCERMLLQEVECKVVKQRWLNGVSGKGGKKRGKERMRNGTAGSETLRLISLPGARSEKDGAINY